MQGWEISVDSEERNTDLVCRAMNKPRDSSNLLLCSCKLYCCRASFQSISESYLTSVFLFSFRSSGNREIMQDYKKDFSYRVLISAGGDSIKSKQAEAYKEGFFSKTPIINCPQLSYLWGIEINIKILLSFFRVPISRIAKI